MTDETDKIIIDLEGERVDLLTLPSVKVADLLVDSEGNISVIQNTAPASDIAFEPEAEERSHTDSLAPLEGDLFAADRGTGPDLGVLSPLPRDLHSGARPGHTPLPERQNGGDVAPVFVPIMQTNVDNRDILLNLEPDGAVYPTDVREEVYDGAYFADSEHSSVSDGAPSYADSGYLYGAETYSESRDSYVGDYGGTDYNAVGGDYYSAAPDLGSTDETLERAREEEMYYLLEAERRRAEMPSDNLQADALSPDSHGDSRAAEGHAAGGAEALYYGYEHTPHTSPDTAELREQTPDGASVARHYTALRRLNKRAVAEGRERDVLTVRTKAEIEVFEAEISLLEAELSFGKKYMTAIEKRELRERRARLKARRRALTRVKKTAEKRNDRYYLPELRAEELISSSLNPDAAATLIDRLRTLLERREGINERLLALYTGSQRKGRGSLKARYAHVAKHLRRARDKQVRLAKAIHKNSVPREDRVRLYGMMDEWVSLTGRIKGIEYMLNKERPTGAAAAELRRERRMLLAELERVSRELHRAEMETIRRARTRRSIRTSMMLGWGAVLLLVGLGALAYFFREPLWELIRGWVNALLDLLGWTHFGRL